MLRTFALALSLLFTVPLLTGSAFAQTERWARENWNTDFSKFVIALSDVANVIPRDAIPSIDAPKFHSVSEETNIPGQEPVVAFELNGDARAYPIRYLMWHEIVNDVVGGLPVAVTFCPLCNTAVVFERTLDGETVEFGTSGKLRNSDLIMYDRSEHNWWQQFSGRAIVGARAGEKLRKLPASMISLDMFKKRWPEGQVLEADPRTSGRSGVNPYANYDRTPIPFLFRGELPKDIEAMMRVALVDSETPIAVSLSHLTENAPVRIGKYEFRWEAGQSSALDTSRIADGREVGNIEVYEIDANGKATLAVHEVTFAFAARAFIPDLDILQ